MYYGTFIELLTAFFSEKRDKKMKNLKTDKKKKKFFFIKNLKTDKKKKNLKSHPFFFTLKRVKSMLNLIKKLIHKIKCLFTFFLKKKHQKKKKNIKKILIKFRFYNFKQKFTLRNLFITFISLLVVFVLRLYLINLCGLDLNTFNDYFLLAILAGGIKALLLDLFDTVFPVEYFMDKETEQSLLQKQKTACVQRYLAEDLEASINQHNLDLNNKIADINKKIKNLSRFMYKNNISFVLTEDNYVTFVGENKHLNIAETHQYSIQVEIEKLINLQVKADIFQRQTGKIIPELENSKLILFNTLNQVPYFSQEEIKEMYEESFSMSGNRQIEDPSNRPKG